MPYSALRRGRVSIADQTYVVTTVCHDRHPFFLHLQCARIAVLEMRHAHESGLVTSLAFVVMPDHVHWLFALRSTSRLPVVIKLFKGRSSRRINEALNRRGQVWQKAYYEHALRADEDLREQARYIVANPLRAGLVSDIGLYPHWDAVWLNETLSA